MTVWSTGVIRGSQTDCFTQLHLPHPEERGMLLTTPYVVCGTGCVGAVGRAPGGHTRSLSKQIFALIKVALEMKYCVWFYNFHNWDSRGFLIYHSWLPAGLFLKKSACYKFFPPSNLMLLDYQVTLLHFLEWRMITEYKNLLKSRPFLKHYKYKLSDSCHDFQGCMSHFQALFRENVSFSKPFHNDFITLKS